MTIRQLAMTERIIEDALQAEVVFIRKGLTIRRVDIKDRIRERLHRRSDSRLDTKVSKSVSLLRLHVSKR